MWVARSALLAMRDEAGRHGPLESGGLALGYRVSDQEAVVTDMIGPGPAAEHRSDRYKPDVEYQEAELGARFVESDGRATYLGDWHSHPGTVGIPSAKDRRTLKRIARAPEAACPQPVMLILGQAGDEWLVEAWQGRLGLLGRLIVVPATLRLWDRRAR